MKREGGKSKEMLREGWELSRPAEKVMGRWGTVMDMGDVEVADEPEVLMIQFALRMESEGR